MFALNPALKRLETVCALGGRVLPGEVDFLRGANDVAGLECAEGAGIAEKLTLLKTRYLEGVSARHLGPTTCVDAYGSACYCD